mmetsp:Transcript_89167/g.252817  ORF Transcript_89167/g.252817 Transcript_89167/m.252817 type:complete len:227 (-) Transcript_89167:302-982(-)
MAATGAMKTTLQARKTGRRPQESLSAPRPGPRRKWATGVIMPRAAVTLRLSPMPAWQRGSRLSMSQRAGPPAAPGPCCEANQLRVMNCSLVPAMLLPRAVARRLGHSGPIMHRRRQRLSRLAPPSPTPASGCGCCCATPLSLPSLPTAHPRTKRPYRTRQHAGSPTAMSMEEWTLRMPLSRRASPPRAPRTSGPPHTWLELSMAAFGCGRAWSHPGRSPSMLSRRK